MTDVEFKKHELASPSHAQITFAKIRDFFKKNPEADFEKRASKLHLYDFAVILTKSLPGILRMPHETRVSFFEYLGYTRDEAEKIQNTAVYGSLLLATEASIALSSAVGGIIDIYDHIDPTVSVPLLGISYIANLSAVTLNYTQSIQALRHPDIASCPNLGTSVGFYIGKKAFPEESSKQNVCAYIGTIIPVYLPELALSSFNAVPIVENRSKSGTIFRNFTGTAVQLSLAKYTHDLLRDLDRKT